MSSYTRRHALKTGTAAAVGLSLAGCTGDNGADADVVSDPDGDPSRRSHF
ncbi:hypothetical protein D8S78_21945 [Natrialba swarupiae]|nr:hypothetical protein [Natrialba swarupiae]